MRVWIHVTILSRICSSVHGCRYAVLALFRTSLVSAAILPSLLAAEVAAVFLHWLPTVEAFSIC